jgi:hypothetical protein
MPVGDILLDAFAESEHGHQRSDAYHDSARGQKRAELLLPQIAEGLLDVIGQSH